MRNLLISVILFLLGCAAYRNIGAPTDDPNEIFILRETQRYAGILDVKVTAEVTDEVFMTMSSDGSERVPAAGWFYHGHIKYWRPVVRDYEMSTLTMLAIHEVCHARSVFHGTEFADCMIFLRNK